MTRVISKDEAGQFKKWQPKEFAASVLNPATSQKTIYSHEEVEALLIKEGKKAYENGVQEGIKQAQLSLNETLQQEWQQKLNHLNNLITSLQEPIAAMEERLEQDLLKLVTSMASALYRREVEINPEQILAVIREAKSLIPNNQENIRIYLNPEDSKLLQEPSFDLKDDSLCPLFIEDEHLKRGDCRVISEQTQVDATLEARLATMMEQLFSHG